MTPHQLAQRHHEPPIGCVRLHFGSDRLGKRHQNCTLLLATDCTRASSQTDLTYGLSRGAALHLARRRKCDSRRESRLACPAGSAASKRRGGKQIADNQSSATINLICQRGKDCVAIKFVGSRWMLGEKRSEAMDCGEEKFEANDLCLFK